MDVRHALACAAIASVALGCNQSHEVTGGDEGVCCPVTDFTGCSPGSEPLAGGGWAPRADACSYAISGYDGYAWVRTTDEHGCAKVVEDPSQTCGVIMPPPPIDAGPLPGCPVLGPAACVAAGCIPTFDDACCPTCTGSTGCADCRDLTFYACLDPGDSCRSESCSLPPPWSCAGAEPDCASAEVTDVDSCDVRGCVPAYPSGMGDPDPTAATCVPIHADVCAATCEVVPPACPSGTVPEGDGVCFTGLCIPAFVCA